MPAMYMDTKVYTFVNPISNHVIVIVCVGTTAPSYSTNYSKWLYKKRAQGKMSRDVGDEKEEEEEGIEERVGQRVGVETLR